MNKPQSPYEPRKPVLPEPSNVRSPNPKCPECKGEIQLGIAIHPNEEYGARYLVKPSLITHKTMELISVYKCKSCGYSCDDYNDLI